MANRFRIEMEFDTQKTYDQFRVIALHAAIQMQTYPHGAGELVYLATSKVDDARHEPIDQR